MLAAHICDELISGARVSRFHVFIAAANSIGGFGKVLPLPFQVGSECVIERGRRILAPPFGVSLQLCFALRFEWDCVHGYVPNVMLRRCGEKVKTQVSTKERREPGHQATV